MDPVFLRSTGFRREATVFVRLVRPPSSGGISPVNWLPERDSSVQVGRGRPAQVGISSRQLVVVREVQRLSGWSRPPSSRRNRRPSTGCARGTAPCRLNRPPSSGGISPVNWLDCQDPAIRQVGRGRPAQAESRPSTGCPRGTAFVRLDEAAQLRRNLARQLVVGKPPAPSGWTGRPAQAESRPSTGC